MQKRVEIPTKPRFSLATQKAYELLAELGISEFPVDPRKIIRHFPSWHLKGWLELQVNTNEEDPLCLEKDRAEAKTVKLRGTDDYLIVYDERVNNSQRIRWTLAHEIGHIIMGHLVDFNATALNRRGLTKEEYGVLEVEAHWFASDLLAPKTIIRRFDFHDDAQGIALICDISKDAAERRLKDIKRMDFGYYPTENRLLRNFYNHLYSGGFYQAVHETAYRFYPSVIYPDLCKEARICCNCNSFVTDEHHQYCSVCGEKVPHPDKYQPISRSRLEGTPFYIGYPITLQGKQYYEIPMNGKSAEFCPMCKTIPANDTDETCAVCKSPLINHCTNEMKKLKQSHRYCPDCGAETTFKAVYDQLPERLNADGVQIPDRYDDYIGCDYWPFVVFTVGYWEKAKELYAALEDSVAFYDCEDMVIFVRNDRQATLARQGQDIILTCLQKHGDSPVKNIEVMVAEPAA